MKVKFLSLVLVGFLASCKSEKENQTVGKKVEAVSAPAEKKAAELGTVVRVNATSQEWSAGQPWDKAESEDHRGLGSVVQGKYVLVTAELVANETYVELESVDGKKQLTAKVKAVDYEADLALLEAEDEKEGERFFAGMKSFELAGTCEVGDGLEMVQVEENGRPILTKGNLQSAVVGEPLVREASALMYRVKAPMQSGDNSFMLPVVKEGKLAGLLTSYDSDDQICEVIGLEGVVRFLDQATREKYEGQPDLDLETTSVVDRSLRDFLQMKDEQGGVYISSVGVTGAAAKAGLKRGDVLVAVDGQAIDRMGYFVHPRYGSLSWTYLIRQEKRVGESVKLEIFREGKTQEVNLVLERKPVETYVVPRYTYGEAPHFAVEGGLIFQELTETLLKAFGNDWDTKAPLTLLNVYHHPEEYQKEGVRRVVFLSAVIPTPATQGYERLRNVVVKSVNGVKIRDMKDLVEAFRKPNQQGLHWVEFEAPVPGIFLDARLVKGVNQQLLQRGLPVLNR